MIPNWLDQKYTLVKDKFERSVTFQRIASNLGWLFFDNLLRLGVGLFVGAWVARYLGPKLYGTYNYALAYYSIFSVVATLGLERIVVRDLVREPDRKEEILGSAFFLKLIGGAIAILFCVGSMYALRPSDRLTHWLIGIIAAGSLFQSIDVINFWFQSHHQSKYVVVPKNTALLIISAVKVFLIIKKASLIAFAVAGLIEIALGSLGLVLAYRHKGYLVTAWKLRFTRARQLLSDCWPLIFSGLALHIHAKIDQVMLGEMIGESEVGHYSAAMKLIEFFGFLPMIVYSSVAPIITKAKLESETRYHSRLLNLYRFMFILFLITAIPLFILSEKIVVIIFGNDYRAAGVLLSLFAVRLFFTNMGVAKSLFITNENLFRYSLISAILGAVINIVLNYLLIPKYASIGAIWAMIISFFFTTFIFDLFYKGVRQNLKLMTIAVFTPWKITL